MTPAGCHEVRFDGEKLAPGCYFLRLAADRTEAVEKMLVVK
jgi:hypothetical protein